MRVKSSFWIRRYKKNPQCRNRTWLVGEEPYFYDNVSVSWYGKFASQVYDPWDQNKYERLCRAYGLDPGKKTKELSRGMKVKLGLSLALAHNPKLLIIDEPTSGMDTASGSS
jgi:ABC-2 type transport system ATP-binding protein